MLISIDIVQRNLSLNYPVLVSGKAIEVKSLTMHDLEGARFRAYTSSIAERRLRGRWLTSLKVCYVQIIWKLGYIIFGLRLFPWFLTFLVDLVIDLVFSCHFGVFAQMLLASIFVKSSKQSSWSPQELMWEWISRNWEDRLVKTIVVVGILYTCCKYIPAVVLSLALSDWLDFFFRLVLMPWIIRMLTLAF